MWSKVSSNRRKYKANINKYIANKEKTLHFSKIDI